MPRYCDGPTPVPRRNAREKAAEPTITNGERSNLRRLVMMTDLLASALMRPLRPETRSFVLRSRHHAFFPLTFVGLGLWVGFLAFRAVDLTSRVLGLGPLAASGVRADGVRFNDIGTFRRANRLHAVPAELAAA